MVVVLVIGALYCCAPSQSQAQPHAGAASAAYKRCRDVILRNADGSLYTRTRGLFEKHTTCGVARRLARRYLADDGESGASLFGFTCSGGGDGVACRKGRRRVTWGYYSD
jgi:hypothetical protein